jgi:hypothetical protein
MATTAPILPHGLLVRRQVRTDGINVFRHPAHRHPVRFSTVQPSRNCLGPVFHLSGLKQTKNRI